MQYQLILKYCVTLEDSAGNVYDVFNTDDVECAIFAASDFYARSRNYQEAARFRKCACVRIMKRDDNGDYNSIASFTR